MVPDATFAMSQTGKANVQAAVTQEKRMFRGSDYTGDLDDAVKMDSLAAGESTGTPIDGSIAAPDLSAGAWSGAFNFTIGLKEAIDPVTLTRDNLSNYVDAETGEAIATSGDVVIPAVVKNKDTGAKYQVIGINGGGWNSSIFPDPSAVASVTISDNITNIGSNTFFGCSNLTSINIPAGVMSIGENAFVDCNNLTTITVDVKNTVYDSRESCNAIIETATNKLIRGCDNTVIPNNITSIGAYAFNNCNKLKSVNIPSCVTSIGGVHFTGVLD